MPPKPKYVSDDAKKMMLDLRSHNKTLQEISDCVDIPRERVRQILAKLDVPARVPITLDLMDYSDVDQLWLSEFRGFFMGEGYCGIDRNLYNPHKASYQVRLAIQVRDDDDAVIKDIYDHVGGTVVHGLRASQTSRPSTNWQLVGWSRVTNLLPLLLQGVIPSKKRRDLVLMNELCQKRLCWPYNLQPEHVEEIHRTYEALKAIKRYKGSEG